jgi:hypothetical protein
MNPCRGIKDVCICNKTEGHSGQHLCSCGLYWENSSPSLYDKALDMIADVMMILRENLENVPKNMDVRALAKWCVTEQQRKAIREYERFRDKDAQLDKDYLRIARKKLDDISRIIAD